MSRLYEVEIIVRAVIVATDIKHALSVARNEASDIVRNDSLDDIDVHDINTVNQLPAGWDDDCLPFGNTDDRKIGDYLSDPAYHAPIRDTKTIDMFGANP